MTRPEHWSRIQSGLKGSLSIMKNFLVLVAMVALAAVTGRAQTTYTGDQVLSKMDQAAKIFKSFEASVERTKVTVLVNDKAVDTGKWYVTRSGNANRVKIDFTASMPQSLLLDK